MIHQVFMNEALKEAKKAFDLKEVPVGAVLVYEEKIIAKAHNAVEINRSVLYHAEAICLNQLKILQLETFAPKMSLYTTLEPCPMCLGLLLNMNINKIIYGAKEPRMGAIVSFVDHIPLNEIEIIGGILEEECRLLMKNFFKLRREENGIRSR